jgi:LL-diaminopimelate aminotransferase
MARLNPNYRKLKAGYLFPEIGRRVAAFQAANPAAKIIRLGIGDVVLPLPTAVLAAMHRAVDDMGTAEGFHGYGPEQGYDFLREAIAANDYRARGCDIDASEVFVSDGSKCDSGNFQELFASDARRRGARSRLSRVRRHERHGRAYRRGGGFGALRRARVSARHRGERLLSGAPPPSASTSRISASRTIRPVARRAASSSSAGSSGRGATARSCSTTPRTRRTFREKELPRSIFEIDGAREVAVEFRSFSKTAGFTGTRCAFVVIPKELHGEADGHAMSVHAMWNRRHSTKFNGVPYVIQRGAEALYTSAGRTGVRERIDYYMENARIIRDGLAKIGATVFGGVNAPYVWVKTPDGLNSWQFFDRLLGEAYVVGTPGAGFGSLGEGYLRLSAFGIRSDVEEAVERIADRV